MAKNIIRIFTLIFLVFAWNANCSAEFKLNPKMVIWCFFDTAEGQDFEWKGCFNDKYYITMMTEGLLATNGKIAFETNQDMMYKDWNNGLSLNEIARKYGYEYVMKIYVQKPAEDLVHFRTSRYKKDYYDVIGINMGVVLADNNDWTRVFGIAGGAPQTHGLLSRENGHYVAFINEFRGIIYDTCSILNRSGWCRDDLADLTKEEEAYIQEHGILNYSEMANRLL